MKKPYLIAEIGINHNGDINIAKKLIKNLKEGQDPPQPQKIKGEPVRTNGQDTVLRAPKRNKNDKEFVKLICSSVMKIQFEQEDRPLKERDNNIMNNLHEMEKSGNFDRQ